MSEQLEIAVLGGSTSYQRRVFAGLAKYAQLASWKFAVTVENPACLGLSLRIIESIEGFEGDGVMYVGASSQEAADEIRRQLKGLEMPVVYAGPFLDGYEMPVVAPDEELAGRLMAEHLLENGLQQFGFFGFGDEIPMSELREKGFCKAVHKRKHPCKVRHEDILPAELDVDEPICAGVIRWLKELPKPVGIGCWYDGYAASLIDLARRGGLRVPEEVSIVGVNNDPVMCTARLLELSSVDLNLEEIGFRAGELLEACIAGKVAPSQPILISPKGVVSRRSSETLAVADPVVAQCVLFICDHISEGLNVSRLLDEVHLSQRNLEYRFTKALGHTPAVEIRRTQIDTATQLLIEGKMSMVEIAFACGFTSQSHFNQVFRRLTNQTPTAFRKANS